MFLNERSILLIFQHSLILFVYFLIFSESVIAEPSKNNVLLINKQQFVNRAEIFAQQRTIPSQLQAIRKLDEALLKWQKLGDKSQEVLTLIKLGEIYKDIGATKLALEHYNKALSLYREFDNRLQEAFILSQIGSIYIIELERLEKERKFQSFHGLFVSSRQSQLLLEKIRSTPEKALELYNKSLTIYRELNNLLGEATILNRMAQSRYLHDDNEEKQKLLEKSLAIYQEIGDKQGEVFVLGFLSELNLIEYRKDRAGWELFDRAMAIYRQITPQNGDDFTIGKAQANLLTIAVDYWWSDNQRKALELFENSLKIYQTIEDKKGKALAIKKMGDRYGWLEDKDKQLEFYTEALGIYQEIGNSTEVANILDSLGRVYYHSGILEKALEFYNQELEKLQEVSQFYSQIGDSETARIFEYRQPIIWFAIGNIYSKLQDGKNEVEAYKQARKIYQKLRDDEGETDFLIKIAEYYGNQENLEKMIEFLMQAVTIYQENGNLQAEANLLRNKIAGIYFYKLKDSETGFEVLNQSLKIYRQIGETEAVAKTLSRIGYLYLYTAKNELQNPLESKRKALEFYSQALLFYREINDFNEEAYILRTIGKIYYELGNKKKALEAFEQVGKVFLENGEDKKAVNIFTNIAREDYIKFGDKETALQFYYQAIPISQKLGDYKKEAWILRSIGQLYYELENPNKALETFNQAQSIYQKNNDRSGEAWTIYEIGKSYTTLGDFKKALDFYQQALPIYEQENDAPLREERSLDILIRMSRIYAYLGDSEIALEFCQKSLNYSQEILQSKTISNPEVFRKIGKLCYQIDSPENALNAFEQYRIIYQKLGADREVTGLMRIGKDYTELGDSKQALYFFNRAKKVYQNSDFDEGVINTLIWISRIYFQAGNYQNALDSFNRGLRIAQKIQNSSKEALILSEIGDSYSELGDREKTLELYNRALIIYQKLGDYRQQTDILKKIGQLYQQFGDLEKSLTFYQQAWKISQENNPLDLVSISMNIAAVYSELGKLETALEILKQTLNSQGQNNSSLHTEIGKIYSNLGELKTALQFFNQSLELLENNYPESRAENLFGIAKVEQKQGNFQNALTQIKTAISLIEETRTSKNSPEERLTFFASKQDYYEFYIDLLMELHQQKPSQGYDAQALQISERSKARSLLELLTEAKTDIRKGIEPELVIQERNLQQQLDAIERRRVELFSSEKQTLEQKTAIEQERQYILRKYQEVQAKIREKSPSYAALTQPQPLTLKQIQTQILDDDTLLLQYALGKKRSFLWAVTKNSITSHELPPKALIEKIVKEFRGTVTNRRVNPSSLVETSQSLYQTILAPVASQLKHRRLAIVSDGILHYIPFAAISLPTTSSETDYLPLISKQEIVNLPSASTLSILRQDAQQRKTAPKTIAIIADPIFSADDTRLENVVSTHSDNWEQYNLSRAARQMDVGIWQRLPETRTEAEAILALLPNSETISHFDFAANRTQVINSQLNQYRIIHFATHGLFNSINPEFSGIMLSMLDPQGNSLNGFLRLHDVFNLDFSADLVVLSACQTGLGKQIRGEGLVGLTRGFMYAGTPRVLVSLWNIDDAATSEIMSRFYRLMLKEKLSPTEALRKAQLEMISETPWKDPYYWAAFTLQGEWEESH